MSYTPTEWKAGDTVTSAKLNKIEQGIASGVNFEVINMEMVLNQENYSLSLSLDKTAGEIIDILKLGKHILVTSTPDMSEMLYGIPASDDMYDYINAIPVHVHYAPTDNFQISLYLPGYSSNNNGIATFQASSLDQYPSYSS